MILPCIADTHLATYQDTTTNEQIHAYGKDPRLKIKHRENFPLLQFDFRKIPSHASINESSLFLHLADADHGYFLSRLYISTVPTPWIEGEVSVHSGSHDYACLLWPGPRNAKWGWEKDPDILGSIFGNGGNVTVQAIPRCIGNNWWEIPLPPRVVEAMRKDQPGGIILQDEHIKRPGKYANIFIDSRESKGGQFAPYLKVTYAIEDLEPPGPPIILSIDSIQPGVIIVTIQCSGDDGDRGMALGLDIQAIEVGKETTIPIPRYAIPRPGPSGSIVKGWIEGLNPQKQYRLSIRAYDEANHYSPYSFSPPFSPTLSSSIPQITHQLFTYPLQPIELSASTKLWVIDELSLIPASVSDLSTYFTSCKISNLLYDPHQRKIFLKGCRGEILGWQMVIETASSENVQFIVSPLKNREGHEIPPSMFRLYRVMYAEKGRQYYPEVVVPDLGPYRIPSVNPSIPRQNNQAIFFDLIIPSDIPHGLYTGTIHVQSHTGNFLIPLELQVYPALIPSSLNFLIELNAYGVDNREYFFAVHRLAHYHRLSYNVLSYSHKGSPTTPFVPRIQREGHRILSIDWTPWDEWVGPILDGSIFLDLPRKGEPVSHFYLPFYENWPMPLREFYLVPEIVSRPESPQDPQWDSWKLNFVRLAPPIEQAFHRMWSQLNQQIIEAFRQHCEKRGWNRTQFQFFLNNKYYIPSGSISYWTLDEPQCADDFRALQYILNQLSKPFLQSSLRWTCRIDLSYPELMGDLLQQLASPLLNISGSYYRYLPLIQRYSQLYSVPTWLYGGGCGIGNQLSDLYGVILHAWIMGADGCMPYWTSFSGDTRWEKGSDLRQVYPGTQYGYQFPVTGSIRLHAMRRAQQDVELLILLMHTKRLTRNQIVQYLSTFLDFSHQFHRISPDDPGHMMFPNLHSQAIFHFRYILYELLLHSLH